MDACLSLEGADGVVVWWACRELLGSMSLDKKEMRRFMASLGIVMQDDQVRQAGGMTGHDGFASPAEAR